MKPIIDISKHQGTNQAAVGRWRIGTRTLALTMTGRTAIGRHRVQNPSIYQDFMRHQVAVAAVASSQDRRINNNKSTLRECFWKENTFWSDGYFACSIGNASYQTTQECVRNQ